MDKKKILGELKKSEDLNIIMSIDFAKKFFGTKTLCSKCGNLLNEKNKDGFKLVQRIFHWNQTTRGCGKCSAQCEFVLKNPYQKHLRIISIMSITDKLKYMEEFLESIFNK